MNWLQTYGKGLILCIAISIPSFVLGKMFPIVGGPIFAIVLGMLVGILIKDKTSFTKGITFTSKKILQYAVILLGFGLNLNVILETGMQSLPIILSTIATSLICAYLFYKLVRIPAKTATLIGVGSSICGGSAIAATAPVIEADDDTVAQSISVIFLFNALAALLFPILGQALGFSTTNGEAFGIFAGTAINDTSSVTAAASTWDNMFALGSSTLDKAVTVKLTRTLAIIPITLALAYHRGKKAKQKSGNNFSLKRIFPMFILYFVLASCITTIAISFFQVSPEIFTPFKEISKICIILAMSAIGFNTDIVKLVRTGGKPVLLGFSCWISISIVSLLMQHLLGIW